MATPEIPDLPSEPEADVTDDDLLLLYEVGAGSDNSKQVTRGRLLKDVAREGGDHDFGTSEITDLTAPTATLNNVSITTGLTFDTAATINKAYVASATVVVPDITAGSSDTQTATLTGVTTADFLTASMTGAMPDGLTMQAWVSAADTVSVKFYNTTAATITGASYPMKLMAFKAS